MSSSSYGDRTLTTVRLPFPPDNIQPSHLTLNPPPGTTLPYPAEQPCHIGAIYNCCCELSKIIHKSLYALYCSTTTINSKDVARIYNEYLDWYKNVPEILRLGRNFTPQVLVVQ